MYEKIDRNILTVAPTSARVEHRFRVDIPSSKLLNTVEHCSRLETPQNLLVLQVADSEVTPMARAKTSRRFRPALGV
jgi:hypothetical protein